jgi:hypothetical protein
MLDYIPHCDKVKGGAGLRLPQFLKIRMNSQASALTRDQSGGRVRFDTGRVDTIFLGNLAQAAYPAAQIEQFFPRERAELGERFAECLA